MTALASTALEAMRASNIGLSVASAAHELTDEARNTNFKDIVASLDANQDGRLTPKDALGVAARAGAKAFSAVTGIEIDTTAGFTADPAQRARDAARDMPEETAQAQMAAAALAKPDPMGRAPAFAGVAGLHAMYDEMRAMR
ncbi:MAG: hypothetical protein ACRBCL_02995 [Maritimibacter sp.]